METDRETIWNVARIHRDRAWDELEGLAEPAHDDPKGDSERYWFHHGRAVAYAAIMSECESMR
jgi:hypothetical protein